MVNTALIKRNVQDYIRSFDGNISKLAFTGGPFENISTTELIQQIESRRRIEKKLPIWFNTQNIFYPPKINLEQTSSEITARYKTSIISGKSVADITGGFGVDSYFFSEKFESVHHFEINLELSEIAQHNFRVFNKKNIQCSNEDGLEAALQGKYNVIYADPSRRHETKGKVFFLKDCQPNIPENISTLLQNCDSFLLKTSPMLDLSIGVSELGSAAEIHIIAIENEVKEILWLLTEDSKTKTVIKTINFTKQGEEIFNFEWQEKGNPKYHLPQKYLYEPNAAILKGGAFDLVSEKLQVNKLHKNTHLYTSEDLVDFPGRRFVIEKRVAYNKSEMRSALNFKKANISIRNFPESVETIRKKWKINDGGNIYLFFMTNSEDKKEMLICSKTLVD